MKYKTGSLVSARGRDWVVLPPAASGSDWLMLKPLGGTDDEIIELLPELETVSPAEFSLPNPAHLGSARSCAILRDAVRLGLRQTTGPFRSFGHIAVEPHPYQLVPLMMAMRQSTVRLLISDDVGIGKTVEALLIARELLDRGEVKRMTVLCPAQLAEQWQKEMEEKFHIEAETVLPSTVARLERGLGAGTSLFERYPFTIVSLDYIKSERHRLDFIRACPELVIVDEAHSCASPDGGRGGKQRYELVKELAAQEDRHMLFVTATPHSGKGDVFRSLLAFMSPALGSLPDDMMGDEHRRDRELLARYFIQRKRGDVSTYLSDTAQAASFPDRMAKELTWQAGPEWKELFTKTLALARDSIDSAEQGTQLQQRVCWWSALAMLRAVSSSPEAAEATFSHRAPGADSESGEDGADLLSTVEAVDSQGRQATFDQDVLDETAISDVLPGADTSPAEDQAADGSSEAQPVKKKLKGPSKNRYRELARLAAELKGKKDSKLQSLIPHVRQLLDDGYSPIIFCRFMTTARYVSTELAAALKDVTVAAVTGELPPDAREERILELSVSPRRVLVCTDCLSEGINLQEHFSAVIHYDLSWNPTRHEQREGRVDRFGQPKKEIRVITWWGKDNPVDGMILNVLLRKHFRIRQSLGISVPVPSQSEELLSTLLLAAILSSEKSTKKQMQQPLLPGIAAHVAKAKKQEQELDTEWDRVAAQEKKRSRSIFAQQSVNPTEVANALADAAKACGSAATVQEFVSMGWPLLGGKKDPTQKTRFAWYFDQSKRAAYGRHLDLPEDGQEFVFRLPAADGQTYLTRTHPLVEQLAAFLAQDALDPVDDKPLTSRCGVMRTKAVPRKTTLLLCRFRFLLSTTGGIQHSSLAEECCGVAFTGKPQKACWLSEDEVAALYHAQPDANIASDLAARWITQTEEEIDAVRPHLAEILQDRADVLKAAHANVRKTAKLSLRYNVQAQGAPDILGIFIFMPVD
ncbi:MAG: helicase-related protein [Desulfovibrionaceae bacterium]|nr:helicase-related protein [Desulfovibrionaceae bacterium]